MRGYVLGIDGGGTKTLAAVTDRQGNVVGWGTSGSANYHDLGEEAVVENLRAAVGEARSRAGIPSAPFDAAFIGLAGVVSTKDKILVRRLGLGLELATGDNLGVDHDCRVALAGGLSGRPGIVLIAGTGSACFGRAGGRAWRTGGWGHLIGDEGGGYWLGVEAIKATVQGADGRGPATLLHGVVMQHLGLTDLDDVMNRIYVDKVPRSGLATLAPLVLEAANCGDEVATSLVKRGCEELTHSVETTATRIGLGDEPFELALVGGLVRATEVFREPLRGAIQARLPKCRPMLPEMPPVLGACLLALELAGLVDVLPRSQPGRISF